MDKAGRQREYQSHLVRRTFREDGKVKHQTLANITALPPAAIEAIRAILRGEQLLPAGQAMQITRAVPHGHVGLVWAQAAALDLPGLLGPAGRYRDLAMALIISRVIRPGSKLATASWWDDTTLGADLEVAGASTDETYAAMDWLLTRQNSIETKLASATWPSRPTRRGWRCLTCRLPGWRVASGLSHSCLGLRGVGEGIEESLGDFRFLGSGARHGCNSL